MRKITIWIVILAIAYFIFGYIAVLLNWFNQTVYFNLSAIIGGVASVSGLLAFVLSGIKRKDIEAVGIEYLKDIVKSADDLKTKEKELLEKEKILSKKEKEIIELDIKKKEMELLVQKASLNLFIKDQYERTNTRITEIIDDNAELKKLIKKSEGLMHQIEALEIEIEASENVDLLRNIIAHTSLKYDKKSEFEISINNSFLRLLTDTIIKVMKI